MLGFPLRGSALPCLKGFRRASVRMMAMIVTVFSLGGAQALQAAQPVPNAPNARGVIVVGNDRGGYVGQRAQQIRRIRAAGQRVEIRGRVCLSSCTMYLGLQNTCVSPRTTFGFHGPTRNGRRLTGGEFEYWSKIIADHYPVGLRTWYMETARNRVTNYYRLSGRELIQMGVKPCA